MKRIFLTALCLCVAVASGAQDIKDRAAYQLNIDRGLWYNTSSAAGLGRSDMASWRDVSLAFGLESGKFTDSWNGRSQTAFSLKGNTLMDIGSFRVAAEVDVEHNTVRRSKYNNSMYQLDWDMPFFVALNSDELMRWGRTSADLNVRATTPLVLDDMFTFGINLGLGARFANKYASPSAHYSDFTFKLSPSATMAIDDDNIVGLAIFYETNPARSVLARGEDATAVAMMQGLGSFNPRSAGGEAGVGTLMFNTYTVGAGVQYNRLGDDAEFLADLYLKKGASSLEAKDVLQGSVDRFMIGTKLQALFGAKFNRKLTLDFNYNLNYWLKGVNKTTFANNGIIDSKLDYTVYTGVDESSFDWTFGAGIDFKSLSLKRVVPDGKLTAVHILPYAFLGKNIHLSKEETLLVKAELGYNFSVNADYEYSKEETAGNYFVNYMYDDEAEYLSKYFLRTKLDATYTYQVNTILSAYASLGAGWLLPMGFKGSRLAMLLSVGVLF